MTSSDLPHIGLIHIVLVVFDQVLVLFLSVLGLNFILVFLLVFVLDLGLALGVVIGLFL